MSCRQTIALLGGFLDGELSAEHTIEIEEHLAGCEQCRERVSLESAVRTSLRRAVRSDAAPSAGFDARLSGALRAERERLLAAPSVPARPDRRRPAVVPLLLAAAATFTSAFWLNSRGKGRDEAAPPGALPLLNAASMANQSPEQVLDELVNYHARPPAPQITEQGLVERLEPEVGVPVRLPALTQYGAAWEGGSVVPMKNQHAAIFRYRLSNHPVTVYVYDARRVPLRGVLEPRVVHNQPVHVGERRGYSIAALERRGVGYAVASDLKDDTSAELVTTIY